MDKKVGIAVAALTAVAAVALVTFAKAQPPSYCCPVCGECYSTYDELYDHFTTEHPAQDIEIIWD